ncbi:VWA domain-containing protein [Prosthecobacter sp. SYSU 5D2]|uniref:vWA domain-containing protein n=1 Tax=Prosthecobacter sp. SYSU 5D2 TaxID=3134134 RepID=UPI0031FF425D
MKHPFKILALSLAGLLVPLASSAEPAMANIVVFDASGSMWNKMENSTRIEIARQVMSQFMDGYDATQPLGVIAYGHRKRGDCEDIEVIVETGLVTPGAVAQKIRSLLPKGMTPLAESLRRAAAMIPPTAESANILLITDGLETCGGDPCAVAEELIATGIKIRAHVVGFGLTKAEAASLSCIAQLTGGLMFNPSNGQELLDALQQSVSKPAAEPPPPPQPPEEKLFDISLQLKDTGTGLPSGLMDWKAKDAEGNVRDLGLEKGAGLKPKLPAGTWTIIVEGAEGRAEGNITVPNANSQYIDFTAPPMAVEFTSAGPLTAGVEAYLSFAVKTPPPGNARAQYKVGIFPLDDPLTRIVASGQNRYVFAGKKIQPGEYHASLHMPKEPGRYKLAFIRHGEPKTTILAQQEVELVAQPELKLEVPERVVAGTVFEPRITSGRGEYDRLRLFAGEQPSKNGRQLHDVWYSTHLQKNQGLMDAPAQPGKYTLFLTARTADKNVSPETSVIVNVVSAEEFDAASPAAAPAATPSSSSGVSAPAPAPQMPASAAAPAAASTAPAAASTAPAAGKIPVSLMLDGDAEAPLTGSVMWSVKPVHLSPEGKWTFARSMEGSESKMLKQQELVWELAPGFWEVQAFVNGNLHRVVIEVDAQAQEHAFVIPLEKAPKPPTAQPTQWLISAKGGEAALTTPTAPADPKAPLDVRVTLPGIPADAGIQWTYVPMGPDGARNVRDGRPGGGTSGSGGDRTFSLLPGKWELFAKTRDRQFLLVADVQPGVVGQHFTLKPLFNSMDITLEPPQQTPFLKDGFFPITFKIPEGFQGKIALHSDDRSAPALFETDAAELAGAQDQVLPMPARPGFYEIRVLDETGSMIKGAEVEITPSDAASPSASANPAAPASTTAAEPQLRQFGPSHFGTGTIRVDMQGKTHEFATTTKVLAANLGAQVGSRTDNAEAAAFAKSMEGKSIHSAVLRLIAGNLYVTLDGYGNIGPNGPEMMGEKRTSFQVSFALDPKTLQIKDGSRTLSYNAPGTAVTDNAQTEECQITLDTVTPLPGGSLALKGSFSGILTQDMKGKLLATPVPVTGTFDVQRASGNDAISKLLGR